ncbi:CpcT/CpeT family chromophore lyase [Parvularcula lutaonensis]|uniref:CpcT/CpeT family chromophore lyase n=1 Tax=Parvularcula lutaonensis TaxID=491923 RepID=A0ABV7MBZ2_9PROT|nr:CpcT/CpeT family chromophore lyase [Parvularcula lutaonensis]
MASPSDDAEAFARQAVGVWTSAEQASDDAYDYVVTEVVPISVDEGASYIYQQNWIFGSSTQEADSPSLRHGKRPYFQVVTAARDLGDGLVHLTTYRLTSEGRSAARVWIKHREAPFDLDWLSEVACMSHVQKVADGYWEGGATCPNGYKGGARVESRSIRTPDAYVNWDRGFSADGRFIWGPASGGYIFKRWESAE